MGCAGLPLGIQSALITSEGTGSPSCLLASSPSTIHITAQGNTVINTKPLGEVVVVLSATVVSGRFLGVNITRTLTLLNLNATGCFTPQGVTNAVGPTTMVVVGL